MANWNSFRMKNQRQEKNVHRLMNSWKFIFIVFIRYFVDKINHLTTNLFFLRDAVFKTAILQFYSYEDIFSKNNPASDAVVSILFTTLKAQHFWLLNIKWQGFPTRHTRLPHSTSLWMKWFFRIMLKVSSLFIS